MPKSLSPSTVPLSSSYLSRQDSIPITAGGNYSIELYSPPVGLSVCEALYEIFSHYCSPWKTAISSDQNEMMIESMNFVKLCKEAPGLESTRIGRHEFDLGTVYI
jgi:hypothetical protein